MGREIKKNIKKGNFSHLDISPEMGGEVRWQEEKSGHPGLILKKVKVM